MEEKEFVPQLCKSKRTCWSQAWLSQAPAVGACASLTPGRTPSCRPGLHSRTAFPRVLPPVTLPLRSAADAKRVTFWDPDPTTSLPSLRRPRLPHCPRGTQEGFGARCLSGRQSRGWEKRSQEGVERLPPALPRPQDLLGMSLPRLSPRSHAHLSLHTWPPAAGHFPTRWGAALTPRTPP